MRLILPSIGLMHELVSVTDRKSDKNERKWYKLSYIYIYIILPMVFETKMTSMRIILVFVICGSFTAVAKVQEH